MMRLPGYHAPVADINRLTQPLMQGLNTYRQGLDNRYAEEQRLENQQYQRGQNALTMAMRQQEFDAGQAERAERRKMETARFDMDRQRFDAGMADRQRGIDEEKAQRRAFLAGALADQIAGMPPEQQQQALQSFLSSDPDLAAQIPEAYRASPQSTLGFVRALAGSRGYKPATQSGDGRVMRVGDKLVQVQGDGSVREVYSAPVGNKTDPNLAANIAGGIERLRQIPGEFGSTFDNAVGPLQGDPDGGITTAIARGLGSVWEGLTNYGGTKYTGEVRSRIAGDTEALAAAIKPLIRKPGEGAWTDADQARLVSVVGNLSQARNQAEYLRALEGVRQRVMSNFGIELPPLGGGPPQPASGAPTPAGGVLRATNPQTGEVIESRDGGQTWSRSQ